MGLHLWSAHSGGAAAQCAGGFGLRRDGAAPCQDPAGHPQLRLRLASALCPGADPGPVHLQSTCHRAGYSIQHRHPVRRDCPGSLFPLHGRFRHRPRGLVRGCQEPGGKTPAHCGIRLSGGRDLEHHAALFPAVAGGRQPLHTGSGAALFISGIIWVSSGPAGSFPSPPAGPPASCGDCCGRGCS